MRTYATILEKDEYYKWRKENRDKEIIISLSGIPTLKGRNDYRGKNITELSRTLPKHVRGYLKPGLSFLRKTDKKIDFYPNEEIIAVDQGGPDLVLDCDRAGKRVIVFYMDSGQMSTFNKGEEYQF